MHCPHITDILKQLVRSLFAWLLAYPRKHHWRLWASWRYLTSQKRFMHWRHPDDLNQVINYQQYHTDTALWSQLTDKYAVRQWVIDKGLGDILIPLYGVWDSVSSIDFSSLPNQFAIRTNCSCGDTLLIRDLSTTNTNAIKKHLQKYLDQRDETFTYSTDLHYLKIPKKIVCEQLLDTHCLDDYKVWCFNGAPFCIFTASNRDNQHHTVHFGCYDLQWNYRSDWMADEFRNNIRLPKPQSLDQLLHYAALLSEGFPQVRVDFYIVSNKIYFGEMTFSTHSGRMTLFSKPVLKQMGALAMQNSTITR